MNTSNSPSPLVPQGSMLEKNAGRSRVKLAFFCVVGVHVAGLMVLLMQGCKREATPGPDSNLTGQPPITDNTNLTPPVDAGITSAPPVDVGTTGATVNLPPDQGHTPPPPPPPPGATAQEYVIEKNDVLSSIAKKFPGVSVKMIQEANPKVNPLALQVGHKLIIPAPVPKAEPTVNGTAGLPSNGELLYVVKTGDALEKIAKKYGTTVKAIQDANNLTTTKINVGQKLKIPSKAPPPPLQ